MASDVVLVKPLLPPKILPRNEEKPRMIKTKIQRNSCLSNSLLWRPSVSITFKESKGKKGYHTHSILHYVNVLIILCLLMSRTLSYALFFFLFFVSFIPTQGRLFGIWSWAEFGVRVYVGGCKRMITTSNAQPATKQTLPIVIKPVSSEHHRSLLWSLATWTREHAKLLSFSVR